MPVFDIKYAWCSQIILTSILFYVNMRVIHVKVQLIFVNLPVNYVRILSQNTAFEHIKVISDGDVIRSHIYIMFLLLNVHILHFDIIYLHVYINKSHVDRMKSHRNINMLYLARYHWCKKVNKTILNRVSKLISKLHVNKIFMHVDIILFRVDIN